MRKEAVDAYLEPMSVQLEEKARNLYEERFLLYVRSATRDGTLFLKGSCAAEMKKSVCYCVDVVVDKEGVIEECQCECAVGTGPTAHCKHVQCLLYGLTLFGKSGQFVTHRTCTQKLQTFNKCKTYKGSPLKAENLDIRSQGQGRELKRMLDFDPRPPKYVKMDSYQSFFNNLCINYQSTSKLTTMPVLQCQPPANMYGLTNDHDYLESSMDDLFLQSIYVKSISVEQRDVIEKNTQGQSKCKEWFLERTKRLTASNFGRICKCTDRTDKVALSNSYMNVKKVSSKSIQHGQTFEKVAVKKYEEQYSLSTKTCGIFVSLTHPFISATPDAVVDDNIIVEVKCPYVSREKIISPQTVPYLRCVDGNLVVDENHDYFYQVQGQLYCTNTQVCKFLVYTFVDFKVITIERNNEFISKMLSKLTSFHEQYFRRSLLQKHFYRNTDKYNFLDD